MHHPSIVLAAVDDLLFSSKIRASAKQAGVEVTFVRSPGDILAQARARRPALVIFDLNSERAAPLETLAALKAEPELAGVRAIGFVSHVQTALIEAAERAGADQVLPRSAFAAHLVEILESAK